MTFAPSVAKEVFRCERIRGKLSRATCAGQWRKANAANPTPQQRIAGGALPFGMGPCVGCDIGKAHARGGQPEVELVELRPSRESDSPRPKPAAQRDQEETMATTVKCGECGSPFERTRGPQRYCSDECRESAKAKRPSASKTYGKKKRKKKTGHKPKPYPEPWQIDGDEVDPQILEVIDAKIGALQAKVDALKLAGNALGADPPYELDDLQE